MTRERANQLKIWEDLWSIEREMLMEVLYTQEAALAFNWSKIGKVWEEVSSPIRI